MITKNTPMEVAFYDLTKSPLMKVVFHTFFVFYCILISNNTLFGQLDKPETDSLPYHQAFADSLLNQGSFQDLSNAFKGFYEEKTIATLYAKTYILKAKKELDTIELANGYDMLCKYNFANYDLAIKYVDSIIKITKNAKHKNYPSRGYLNKGILLTNVKKYKEALAHYLKAEKYAEQNNNIVHQIAIKHNIARLKNELNKHLEAIRVYKENLDFLKNNKIESAYARIYIGSLVGLGESYNKLRKIDSADYYIKRGIDACYRTENFYFYENLLLASGINYTLKKKHKIALDTLFKAEKILPDSWSVPTKPICHTYIGKNLYTLNRKPEAIVYLKKVDSAITATNYIPDVRDAFEILISHYKDTGESENQLELLQKLIRLDSITYTSHNTLNTEITNKYDTEILKQERKALIDELLYQKREFWIRSIIIAIGLSCLLLFLIIWYYRKQKSHAQFVDSILEEKEKILQSTKLQSKKKKEKQLPREVKQELLNQLNLFEKKQRFLNPNLSLSSTAKELQTNSTYLSKIINETTGKNFANYINDLRISYAIEKLHTDPKYRLYAISALAQEVGFNNSKSFTRAFQKRTNQQPSTFIKKLSYPEKDGI